MLPVPVLLLLLLLFLLPVLLLLLVLLPLLPPLLGGGKERSRRVLPATPLRYSSSPKQYLGDSTASGTSKEEGNSLSEGEGREGGRLACCTSLRGDEFKLKQQLIPGQVESYACPPNNVQVGLKRLNTLHTLMYFRGVTQCRAKSAEWWYSLLIRTQPRAELP